MGLVQGLTEFLPDLVVRAPDHRPVPVRLGRCVHQLAGLQRDAPYRDARGRSWSTSGPTGWLSCQPASRRSRDRSLPGRPGSPARVAPRRGDDPRRAGGFPPERRHRDGLSGTSASSRSTLVGRRRHPRARRPLWGPRTKGVGDVTFLRVGGRDRGPRRSLALIPGISRSGISISASRIAGTRPRGPQRASRS